MKHLPAISLLLILSLFLLILFTNTASSSIFLESSILNKVKNVTNLINEVRLEHDSGYNQKNVLKLEQITNMFASQIVNTSSLSDADIVINELYLYAKKNPYGPRSVSLVFLANYSLLGYNNDVVSIINSTSPPPGKALDTLVTQCTIMATGIQDSNFYIEGVVDNLMDDLFESQTNLYPTTLDLYESSPKIFLASFGMAHTQQIPSSFSRLYQSLESVLYQIILETGYKQRLIVDQDSRTSITPAGLTLMNISFEVSSKPNGLLSKSIIKLANEQRKGNTDIVNQAILEMSTLLAKGESVNTISQITERYLSSNNVGSDFEGGDRTSDTVDDTSDSNGGGDGSENPPLPDPKELTIDAGKDLTVTSGKNVTLVGEIDHASDAKVNYKSWVQKECGDIPCISNFRVVTQDSSDKLEKTFTAPDVQKTTVLEFQFTAGASSPSGTERDWDMVKVTINPISGNQVDANWYSSKEDYSNGYADGLTDAKRDQKCLNGHGYDPSIHHGSSDFRKGYTDGYLSYSTTNAFLGCKDSIDGDSTSDYDDGYADGLTDAKRDQKCLNGHGYDPSIHHGSSDFRKGYTDGYLSYSTINAFLGCKG